MLDLNLLLINGYSGPNDTTTAFWTISVTTLGAPGDVQAIAECLQIA